MNYDTQYAILKLPIGQHPLWRQAYVAVVVAARDIRGEAPTTTNHAARLAWAQQAEQQPEAMVNQMRLRILTNATITDPEQTTDSGVQTVVADLVNDFATEGN